MAKEGRDDKGKFAGGNLFSIGNNGGHPPHYKTPKELTKKIAEYLEWEDTKKRPDSYSNDGKGVYTLSGCALFLGFATRQSFDDQGKRGTEYSDIINRFRLFMTDWNEKKLYWGGTFNGSLIWLKNHGGYSDEVQSKIESIVTNVTTQIVGNSPPLENKE